MICKSNIQMNPFLLVFYIVFSFDNTLGILSVLQILYHYKLLYTMHIINKNFFAKNFVSSYFKESITTFNSKYISYIFCSTYVLPADYVISKCVIAKLVNSKLRYSPIWKRYSSLRKNRPFNTII